MRLILTDRCNAAEERKPTPLTIEGVTLTINEDTITLGEHRLLRIEPIGWGDVHWQLGDTSQTRFTHIEVAP